MSSMDDSGMSPWGVTREKTREHKEPQESHMENNGGHTETLDDMGSHHILTWIDCFGVFSRRNDKSFI